MTELADALRRRRAVIADHPWRERDPAAQLAALAEVSTAISDWTVRHRAVLDPQLRHFLERASFDKALAYITTGEKGEHAPNHRR